MLQQGVIAGGRYRLIRAIGEGGMSTVWEARHELLNRPVALKLLPSTDDEELTSRFLREAQIIGQFHHRNIVSVLDAGELPDEGYHFLVMELLQGGPFADRLIPGEPLHATDAIPILIEVCNGLEVAHKAGVVHRDIKPENIFLAHVPGEGLVPKIVDFGISKLADANAKITADGQILGTPAYMSPEQALGRSDITHSVDIWAMGVMLYEALGGEQPFSGPHHIAVLESIIDRDPPPLPPWIDERTRAIIDRCLRKDPRLRYPDAATLRYDLEVALEEIVTRCSRPTSKSERNARPPAPSIRISEAPITPIPASRELEEAATLRISSPSPPSRTSPPSPSDTAFSTTEPGPISSPWLKAIPPAQSSAFVYAPSQQQQKVREDGPTLLAPQKWKQALWNRKSALIGLVLTASVSVGAYIASPPEAPAQLDASLGRIALRTAQKLVLTHTRGQRQR